MEPRRELPFESLSRNGMIIATDCPLGTVQFSDCVGEYELFCIFAATSLGIWISDKSISSGISTGLYFIRPMRLWGWQCVGGKSWAVVFDFFENSVLLRCGWFVFESNEPSLWSIDTSFITKYGIYISARDISCSIFDI